MKQRLVRLLSFDSSIEDSQHEAPMFANSVTDTIKSVLLGAGDSGKTTIAKHLRILQEPLPEKELKQHKYHIESRALINLKNLVDAARERGEQMQNAENEQTAKIFEDDLDMIRCINDVKRAQQLYSLWKDSTMRKIFQSNEIDLDEHTEYFLDNIVSWSDETYLPTQQEALLSRTKTTGIIKYDLNVEGRQLQIYDVGGQKSERKKWQDALEGVSVVFYIVSLSDFDQNTYEDADLNRMKDSLDLFQTTMQKEWLRNAKFILVFNKKDVFERKLARTELKKYFPEFDGPNDVEHGMAFIKKQFQDRTSGKQVQCLTTCATDTEQLQETFEEIKKLLFAK